MKLKSIWQRFIAWITFDKTSSHHKTDLVDDRGKHYRLDTSHTLDAGEEVISIKRDKMQDFIDQKKNRTPFYKDDNKKTWE